MNRLLFALLCGVASSAALAQVDVREAWIRATVPSAKSSGLFMQIKSSQDAQLVEVRASVAGVVEIHHMTMDGQMMRMQAVPSLDLPAGKTVDLSSGGYHVMLMSLKRQLKQGETIPVTLVVRRKDKRTDTVSLDVMVKPLTYTPAQAGH
jgi:copper(I)-binding protein